MSASSAARVAQLAARPEVQGDPHAVVAAALLVAATELAAQTRAQERVAAALEALVAHVTRTRP